MVPVFEKWAVLNTAAWKVWDNKSSVLASPAFLWGSGQLVPHNIFVGLIPHVTCSSWCVMRNTDRVKSFLNKETASGPSCAMCHLLFRLISLQAVGSIKSHMSLLQLIDPEPPLGFFCQYVLLGNQFTKLQHQWGTCKSQTGKMICQDHHFL